LRRLVPQEIVVRPTEINGQPGFVAYVSGRPLSALIFDIRDGRIQTIYAIGNPDKLQSLPVPS
jgi:RNA polymerase sigma-70 factor (ECF subfamily)